MFIARPLPVGQLEGQLKEGGQKKRAQRPTQAGRLTRARTRPGLTKEASAYSRVTHDRAVTCRAHRDVLCLA